jgi:hypothetical protein
MKDMKKRKMREREDGSCDGYIWDDECTKTGNGLKNLDD